jgi:hypothetical protein
MRNRSIIPSARENGPRDTGKLVGGRCDDHVDGRSLLERIEPWAEWRSFSLHAQYSVSGTMHEDLAFRIGHHLRKR